MTNAEYVEFLRKSKYDKKFMNDLSWPIVNEYLDVDWARDRNEYEGYEYEEYVHMSYLMGMEIAILRQKLRETRGSDKI